MKALSPKTLAERLRNPPRPLPNEVFVEVPVLLRDEAAHRLEQLEQEVQALKKSNEILQFAAESAVELAKRYSNESL